MAGMYPDNHELSIFGETVQWPGMGKDGKFTNGSFTDPMEKPSFIPAETLNLILDNLSELIRKLGGKPNNVGIDQIAKLFTSHPSAHKAIMRDASGRAKVAAPQAGDDIARKKEVDDAKAYADLKDTEYLPAAKSYTNEKTATEANARIAADAAGLTTAKQYTNELLIKIFQNGYIQWPGMKSPLEIPALHFEGYSWYEVNYRGNFFRAKGANANPFSSKKLAKDQIKNGKYIFQDDEQGDAIRNIKGHLHADESGFGAFSRKRNTGLFQADVNEYYSGAPTGIHDGYLNAKRVIFDISKANGVFVSEENRSRNLTFTLWALVKNE